MTTGKQTMNPEETRQLASRSGSGCLGIALAMAGALLSMFYLANLSFGFLEVPDNLPLVGNIDEVVVSGILFTCLSRLGINPIPNFRRK